MDTSKEYINMCWKANEIQTKYNDGYAHGDYCYTPSEEKISLMTAFENPDARIHYTILYNFWLPRQDQLQEMIRNPKHTTIVGSLRDLIDVVRRNIFDYDTHEKAWLSLVMKQKFNKKWNKEKQEWEI